MTTGTAQREILSLHVSRCRAFEHKLEHNIVYQVKNESAGWINFCKLRPLLFEDFQVEALHPSLPLRADYGQEGQGLVGFIDFDFSSLATNID
jgi:hypothetical protein